MSQFWPGWCHMMEPGWVVECHLGSSQRLSTRKVALDLRRARDRVLLEEVGPDSCAGEARLQSLAAQAAYPLICGRN